MPLARHDLTSGSPATLVANFYSHASCEAWRLIIPFYTTVDNFYSHASCEAWRNVPWTAICSEHFYSHASCEAWLSLPLFWILIPYFYSHASCEAWLIHTHGWNGTDLFLLTCLLRGMTLYSCRVTYLSSISTHMPLARHDDMKHCYYTGLPISTHMPLARHDGFFELKFLFKIISTHMPLARHDENGGTLLGQPQTISTHMPLARHDRMVLCIFQRYWYFYSHASCEAWRTRHIRKGESHEFLLTCLLRGMTGQLRGFAWFYQISTHMPLARHDAIVRPTSPAKSAFLLTCLLRGMTLYLML